MYKVERKKIYVLWFYVFVGSFLLGIIIMNLMSGQLLTEDGIFSLSMINRLKYIEIDGGNFFPFVLKQRMAECALMIIVSATGMGLIIIYADIIWTGFLMGMFFTAAAIRFGLKGLLLIMAGLLPHQCLLVPAGVMLLIWCYENYCQVHCPRKCNKMLRLNKRQQYIRQGILLLWILAVFFIGCILESYVNPILISELIKIF